MDNNSEHDIQSRKDQVDKEQSLDETSRRDLGFLRILIRKAQELKTNRQQVLLKLLAQQRVQEILDSNLDFVEKELEKIFRHEDE